MSIFDLLFVVLFLASVATLVVAGNSAFRGRGVRALRILRRFAVCAGVYLGVVAISSAFWPRRVLRVGDPVCFDDWCICVEKVNTIPPPDGMRYVVALRLSSSARRISQREKGVVTYLSDDRGRRYDPVPEESNVPFDVLLGPQASVAVTRVFDLPAYAHPAGLVITHEGGFPIRWFLIGEESWFHKPTIVRIP
jgi:hypothetical protein